MNQFNPISGHFVALRRPGAQNPMLAGTGSSMAPTGILGLVQASVSWSYGEDVPSGSHGKSLVLIFLMGKLNIKWLFSMAMLNY